MATSMQQDPARSLKLTIWLYFWLLIWEGALRKWVFPGMSDIFFLIRDPVVMVAYLLAIRIRMFPSRPAIAVVFLLAAASLVFSLAADTRFLVTVFGLRTDFLHLPLIFIMGSVLNRRDVIQFGKWTLIMTVPILYLMVRQFNASPDDFLNVGVGGSVGGQLRGALGKIRPAGPFSFISGPVAFYSLSAAFALYGWLQRKVYGIVLLLVGTAATIAAVPVSISRSLLLGVLIVIAFALAIVLRDPKRIPSFLGPLVGGLAMLAFASDSIYVQAFSTRWEESAGAGGGVYQSTFTRTVDQVLQPFDIAATTPIFGYGVGLGTIAGARLNTGSYSFLLSESEFARCILELGPILGFVFVGWRVWLGMNQVLGGWKSFRADADPLSWLIAGATFMGVVIGQWGPATQLGFSVFGAGLTFAAMNPDPDQVARETEEEVEAVSTDGEAADSDITEEVETVS